VCGLNEQHEGPYSHEVPVYPTEAAPPAPDGLDVIVQGDALFISWGKILGALNYKLYELAPTGEKKLIYEGKETSCAWTRDDQAIRRYVVSAVNRNGEGEVCRHPVDDDPASLRNYKPLIDRSFNRQSLYGHHPFLLQNTHRYRDVPSAYPDSIVKANKQ
ncbi:MAG: hypothetical protein K0Q59_2194, partial [Paenibacillus sp.]|nr:hypothetical protein [Paenibacillus sp.]